MPPLSLKEWREFLLVRLPILRWLWEYRHPLLFGDVISGVTVGIMHIPQGDVHVLRVYICVCVCVCVRACVHM